MRKKHIKVQVSNHQGTNGTKPKVQVCVIVALFGSKKLVLSSKEIRQKSHQTAKIARISLLRDNYDVKLLESSEASMSTQESLQIVQQFYAAIGSGDIEALLNLLADDVEWETPFPRDIVPHGGKWHGKDGVLEFLFFLNQNVEFQQFELQHFIAQDDRVAIVGHFKVLVKATGRYYEPDTVVICTVEDGKIKQFREFTDTREAVSAFRGE